MAVRNERLINEVAVGVVFVLGPTADTTMTSGERVDALAEIQDGLELLAGLEPDANVSWVYEDHVVSLTQPIFPDAPWRDLPKSFYVKPIDAALWRETNGRTYLFQGDQYVRLTGSTMDSGYPRPIAGNWKGLPSHFEDGIDAGFWHLDREKFYLFKGDEYVRMTDHGDEVVMDPDYPQLIAGKWGGIDDDFVEDIDAVFMHPVTKKIYMFKGSSYIRLTGTTMDGATYPKKIPDSFTGLPEHYEDGIHAAVWRGDNDRLYFFNRPSRNKLVDYVRMSPDTFPAVESGYPNWAGGLDSVGAEALWRDQAQAALGYGPGAAGYKAYADDLQDQFGTDASIVAFVTRYPVYWPAYVSDTPKIVMSWSSGWDDFDRVFAHETGHTFGAPDEYGASGCTCTDEAGRFTKASNGNCSTCASAVSVDDGYPLSLPGGWTGLQSPFMNGLDAAVWYPNKDRTYMFKGPDYVRLNGTTVESGYPKSIGDHWHNLPTGFDNGIDAAVWRESNGKLYMFKGTQYARLTGTTVDAGYPQPISVGWTGLPQSFLSGIDSAVYRPSNGKYYLFKDHQYVRMSDNGSTIDIDGNNYPRNIGDVWDLPAATAAAGVDAAIWHGDKEKLYLFAGNDYFRVSQGVPCLMRSNSPEVCFYTTSHLGWNGFLTGIDAAVYRGDSQAAYLFSGEWYARFSDIGGDMDAEYPKRIRHGFNNLDEAFHRDLDAALWRESTGQTYLFKGDQYVRLTGSTQDPHYPKPIAGNWKGIGPDFESGIDAALWRQSNDKIYMFKGDQYVRLTETVADTNRDYPCPIDPVWTGLPGSGLPRADAALMRQDTNQIYLFHRRAYVRYSNLSNGPDDDYPAWIDKRWMPFPRN